MLRSRHAEDCLKEAVEQRSLRQYVVLGAGLDTFAYRQPAWARSLKIFEIDHPATQAWKRERLENAGIKAASNIEFVPLDFDDVSLRDGLAAAGFDEGNPSHLAPGAHDDTLRFVASLPPSGEIVFSIAPPADLLPRIDGDHIEAFTQHVASIGEPWLTRPRPAELIAQLRSMGFSAVFHLTPEDANDRYFRHRSDRLEASVIEQMIRAKV